MTFLLFLMILLPIKISGTPYGIEAAFTTTHVLIVDPKENSLILARAEGTGKRETVKIIAKRYKAKAAVNGGFWKKDGSPSGILKIDGNWHGKPVKTRGAIGWMRDGSLVLIDRLASKDPLEKEGVYPILDPKKQSAWNGFDYIVGGGPLLIKNGKIVDDFLAEKNLKSFILKRHPRTAVGIRADGKWVFAVVDGAFYGLFGGMTIKELAETMFYLGCVDALNLDGGGSSTMVIHGVVVNRPEGKIKEDGKWVEAVSDAILILPKN